MKKINLILLLFVIGCAKEEIWKEYVGKSLEIQYDVYNVRSIDQDDIFWVDQIKVSHNRNETNSSKNNIVLPTGKYVVTQVKKRAFENYSNPISYALHLHNAFQSYSNDYEIINLPLLQAQGTVLLKSKTDNPIHIKIKPDYPMHVRVVE